MVKIDKNRLYLIRFVIYFLIFYCFLRVMGDNIAKLLTLILSIILKLNSYMNMIITPHGIIEISSPCTCSLEMALFLGYIFGTPDVDLKYKIVYALFGILIIIFSNLVRIMLIIKYSYLRDYTLIHNIISFMIFPVALTLNVIWIKILIKLNIVKPVKSRYLD